MGMDARITRRGQWLKRLSWALGAVAVIALIVALRHFDNESAQAQTPAARTASRASNVAPGQGAAKAAVLDPKSVVAVVNGEQITQEQLAFECRRRFGPDVLKGMITTYLVQQECTQRGIRVTEKQVDAEIARVADSFGLSPTHWVTLLETERDLPEAKYRREMIWPQLALQQLARDRTDVSDAEVRELFETIYGAKIKTRVIVTTTRAKAEQLLQIVLQNPDVFGQVAKDHSEDGGSAAARGLIPPIARGMGSPEIENVAFALQPGQISGVVPVAERFFVIKCEAIIPKQFVAADNLASVQNQLREQVRSRKINDAAIEISTELEKRSKIEIVYGNAEMTARHPQTAALINGRAITSQQLANECFDRHARQILDGEMHRILLRLELAKRKINVGQPDLDVEIRRAAQSFGFVADKQADVNAWLQHVKTQYGSVDVYVRDAVWPTVALKLLVNEKVVVSEEELQKGFESNYGARVETLAIVLKNERKALEVWEMANNDRTERFFSELAATYSIEPTSHANGGRVPPIRKHGGSKVIEEEAFKLNSGELSGLIGTGDTYVILYCLGRTEPIVDNIEDVREELEKELFERALRLKMGKEMERILTEAKTQSFIPERRVVRRETKKRIEG
jgi:parvulin-like peptidyl-prolyl isomerase